MEKTAPKNLNPKDEDDIALKPSVRTLQVLIVDDNEEAAKVLGWMIEMLDHTPHIVYNGTDALKVAQDIKPDVVLLDIGMPSMNGYEICQMMRRLPDLEKTTFIAQTGWSKPEHVEFSKQAGFDYHLVKPIEIKTLQNLLAS